MGGCSARRLNVRGNCSSCRREILGMGVRGCSDRRLSVVLSGRQGEYFSCFFLIKSFPVLKTTRFTYFKANDGPEQIFVPRFLLDKNNIV